MSSSPERTNDFLDREEGIADSPLAFPLADALDVCSATRADNPPTLTDNSPLVEADDEVAAPEKKATLTYSDVGAHTEEDFCYNIHKPYATKVARGSFCHSGKSNMVAQHGPGFDSRFEPRSSAWI